MIGVNAIAFAFRINPCLSVIEHIAIPGEVRGQCKSLSCGIAPEMQCCQQCQHQGRSQCQRTNCSNDASTAPIGETVVAPVRATLAIPVRATLAATVGATLAVPVGATLAVALISSLNRLRVRISRLLLIVCIRCYTRITSCRDSIHNSVIDTLGWCRCRQPCQQPCCLLHLPLHRCAIVTGAHMLAYKPRLLRR